MGGNGKGKFRKWKISILRSSSTATKPPQKHQQPPPPDPPQEFLCSICGSIMSDPVVVGSGHTFDRICVDVCRDLGYTPTLPDGSTPDFSRTIPNLAFKSTISSWCSNSDSPLLLLRPDYSSVQQIVLQKYAAAAAAASSSSSSSGRSRSSFIAPSDRELIDAVADKKPEPNLTHADTEFAHRVAHRYDCSSSSSCASSEESVIIAASPSIPLSTRPACLSPSSTDSSSLANANPTSDDNENENDDDDEFLPGLTSPNSSDQLSAAVALRRSTRSDDRRRLSLCTPRLLAALRPLLASWNPDVQTNSAAAVVNLSLEKRNKPVILRAGIVPPLVDLLRGGWDGEEDDGSSRSFEAQEHAAGAVFSLSLDDDNKTAIGVLGALPPLIQCLRRSDSDRTRHDSALALYHLTLVQTNRAKLVKLGAVSTLLGIVRAEEGGDRGLAGKALLVLCNLAVGADGRGAMMDGNAVEVLVGLLRQKESSESTRDNCVAALYALSHGSLRFKGLARDAGAAEVLRAFVDNRGGGGGSERAKDKARKILMGLTDRGSVFGGGESVNWEALLEDSSGAFDVNRPGTWNRPADGGGNGGGAGAKSTEF